MQCFTKGGEFTFCRACIFQSADAVLYGAEHSLLPAMSDYMSRTGGYGEGPRLPRLLVTIFEER